MGASGLRFVVPKEHGFWVMLAASVGSAIARTPHPQVAATAMAVALVYVAGAGTLSHQLRNRTWAQLASAPALALAGAIVDLIHKVPIPTIGIVATTWTVVFASGTMLVLGAFAGARKNRARKRMWWSASLAAPALLGSLLLVRDEYPAASACTWATAAAALLLVSRPSHRALKRIGLSLAAISTGAAIALGSY